MNEYIQKVHRERCDAAEKAADHVREISALVANRFREMGKTGVLYTSAQRKADNEKLEAAQAKLGSILQSILEIEEAERQ